MPFPPKISQATSKGLNLFTEEEISACILERADKVNSIDEYGGQSEFEYWIFEVSDERGNIYQWRDLSLAESATKVLIGNAVVDYATTSIYKIPYNEDIESNEGVLHIITIGDALEGVRGRVVETFK